MVIFVDDISFRISRSTYRAAIEEANCIMKEALDWFASNGLILNTEKTGFIAFSNGQSQSSNQDDPIFAGDCQIKKLKSTKFLGLHVDEHLTWDIHVEHVCKTLRSMCYALGRLAQVCSLQALLTVYYSHFESILRYGVRFWGFSSQKNFYRVFKLQKWAVRAMVRARKRESCKPFFKQLNIMTFPSLVGYECCMFVRKNYSSFSECGSYHSYVTRSRQQLEIPKHATAFYEKVPYYTCTTIYNKLPIQIKQEVEVNVFKRKLRNYFIDNSFYNKNIVNFM